MYWNIIRENILGTVIMFGIMTNNPIIIPGASARSSYITENTTKAEALQRFLYSFIHVKSRFR